ncbi:lysophospholipid acyltransferase family protein [Kineococcus sp. R86509]|uniref:lysophospholipid acyltransferase family protein n=1 Tax=Kineococcus sp. R86509 TaxID=3093851 RepID=UPI0036D2AAAB
MQLYRLMTNMLVGPVCRLLYRPRVSGLENIPGQGPAFVAANHLSMMDPVFLPVVLPRQVSFIAKASLFSGRGLRGRLVGGFVRGVGMIPVDRSGGRASQAGIDAAVEALGQGRLFGIFPEGTRSPDGRLYRGRTGVARIALDSDVPVIPVAMVGTDALFRRTKLPRVRRVGVIVGKPLDFSHYRGRHDDPVVLRAITDEIQAAIQALSGQEYVDVYSADSSRSRRREVSRDATEPGSASVVTTGL